MLQDTNNSIIVAVQLDLAIHQLKCTTHIRVPHRYTMYNFPVPIPAYTAPAVGTGTIRLIICVVLDEIHSIQHTHSFCVVKKMYYY